MELKDLTRLIERKSRIEIFRFGMTKMFIVANNVDPVTGSTALTSGGVIVMNW